MGNASGVPDVELWMVRENSVGQQVTDLGLRPSVHNAVDDAVQVGARVEVVRDARGDNRQDIAGTLAAFIEPREEPVATTQYQASELTLSSVIGRFDIPILEKEQQSSPLAIEIAEAFAEWGLGRDDALLLVDPGSKLVEDRTSQSLSAIATLLRVVTGGHRFAFDGEQSRDDAHAFEGDAVAGTRCFYETTPAVGPIRSPG
jgi:hypothetical protein